MYFSSRHWTRYFKSKLLQILFCIYHSHNQRSLFFIVFASDINCIIGKITTACLFHPDRYLNLIPCNLCLWLSNVKHGICLTRSLCIVTCKDGLNSILCYISIIIGTITASISTLVSTISTVIFSIFPRCRNCYICCFWRDFSRSILYYAVVFSSQFCFHLETVICTLGTFLYTICPVRSICTVLPLISAVRSICLYRQVHLLPCFYRCRLRLGSNHRCSRIRNTHPEIIIAPSSFIIMSNWYWNPTVFLR